MAPGLSESILYLPSHLGRPDPCRLARAHQAHRPRFARAVGLITDPWEEGLSVARQHRCHAVTDAHTLSDSWAVKVWGLRGAGLSPHEGGRWKRWVWKSEIRPLSLSNEADSYPRQIVAGTGGRTRGCGSRRTPTVPPVWAFTSSPRARCPSRSRRVRGGSTWVGRAGHAGKALCEHRSGHSQSGSDR